MKSVPESDWKKFKPLRDKALARLCDQILAEVGSTMADGALSSHEQYLEIYSLIQKRNKELGRIFDGYSRSRMLSQLSMMQSYELLEPDELASFSESTQDFLAGCAR
jgi:hypothetical protein